MIAAKATYGPSATEQTRAVLPSGYQGCTVADDGALELEGTRPRHPLADHALRSADAVSEVGASARRRAPSRALTG